MKRDTKEHIISYLEQQRAEKLAEMGGYLRHLRQEQSLSLDEVAAKTKVQARLLHAIEEGRLEPLPEPIYIKGFIQRYADALGLNGAEFASVFPTAQGFQLMKRSWLSMPTAQLKPIHLYLIYVCLIVGAGVSLSNMVNRTPTLDSGVASQKTQNVKQDRIKLFPKTDKTQPVSLPVATTTDEAKLKATNVSQTNEEVRVDITVKAESWVRVKADGKTTFEGLLPEGTQRTWTAKDELVVRAGNAGGVVLALNQGEAKELGEPGTIKEVAFKADE
jgi:cytoskeletal protein RodZ